MKRLPMSLSQTLTITASLLLASCVPANAQSVVPVKGAAVLSSRGTVSTADADGEMTADGTVKPGGSIRTGTGSEATLVLETMGSVKLGPETEVRLPTAQPPDARVQLRSLELLRGRLFLNISAAEIKKRSGAAAEFRLKTPAALLAVKGTKFFAFIGEKDGTIGVNEGSVAVAAGGNPVVTLASKQAVDLRGAKLGKPRALKNDEASQTPSYPPDITGDSWLVAIDCVYQPDGSRDFTNAAVIKSRLVFQGPYKRMADFATAAIGGGDQKHRDIAVLSDKSKGLVFWQSYGNGSNGFYASATDMDKVTEASQDDRLYREGPQKQIPCTNGRVIVVRTYDGKYAKFQVMSVIPPAP